MKQAYRLIQDFPNSQYIPNAYLSFADYYFGQSKIGDALQLSPGYHLQGQPGLRLRALQDGVVSPEPGLARPIHATTSASTTS